MSNVYKIFAVRNKSQFDQTKQEMRCVILEAHKNYFLVESLKRYNEKYPDANVATTGKYVGKPIRRINKDQAKVIVDEKTGKWLEWETVRRREGAFAPGRAKGGK